jgi:hypothetical protein
LIVDVSWLNQLDDVILGHRISLLRWRSAGVKHPHDMPPSRFPPSPTFSDSSLKPRKTITKTFGYLKKKERALSDAMLLQVGRVVVELSNVEHILGFMYGMLGDDPPVRWQYFATKPPNFQTRLKLVNKAVKVKCPSEHLPLWQAVYLKLSGGRSARNRVAHLGMHQLFTADRKLFGVELRPPWYLGNGAARALKIADVRQTADELVEAKADLWDFINAIAH